MTRFNLGRRRWLELMALAGTSSLAAEGGASRRAQAAGPIIPRRLLFFYTAQGALKQFNDDGTIKPQWAPAVSGAPDALALKAPWSTPDFVLGDMHQPLVPWQRQLLFLDGLDMLSADVDGSPSADAHTNGQTHALVGASRHSSNLAGGVSIDQLIARGINSPAPATRLQSLEVAIDATQAGATGPLFAAAGQPVPIVGKAAAIYARLFPDASRPGGGAAQPASAAELARQRSALDFAANDFSNLAARLGKRDAARLDAHAAAIRDLERRLALTARPACVVPDPSAIASASSAGTGAAYAANADVLLRLAQVALACDLTRVVTVCVTQAPNELFGYRAGMAGTSDFHDLVHKTNGIPAPGKTAPPLGLDPQAMRIVKGYHAYNAALFARLLGLLQSIPESDGATLLDHAAVVWCGDIAGGDHSLDHVPYVIGGGLGGSIRSGRYVRMPRRSNNKKWPCYSDGPPHNDLFVSLANAMGLDLTTFGNPKVCSGPLVGALT